MNTTETKNREAQRQALLGQLTAAEAARFTLENVLGGTDGWDPLSGPARR